MIYAYVYLAFTHFTVRSQWHIWLNQILIVTVITLTPEEWIMLTLYMHAGGSLYETKKKNKKEPDHTCVKRLDFTCWLDAGCAFAPLVPSAGSDLKHTRRGCSHKSLLLLTGEFLWQDVARGTTSRCGWQDVFKRGKWMEKMPSD